MRITITACILFCSFILIRGQSLDKGVIPISAIVGSPGYTATVGEIVGGSNIGQNIYVGHGFQQSTASITTSVLWEGKHVEISLFPNPAYDEVHLIIEDVMGPSTQLRYEVWNQLGQLQFQSKITNISMSRINIDRLSPGYYHLTIIGDYPLLTLPFIKL